MIPFRNLLPPTNSQKTKPAYQAMNGRKQIVRGINGIKPDHGLIPESVCHNLRSGIGRRKQDKKTETDNPGYCICCKKAIYTLFFLSRNQNVIDSPKQITSKIDYQCPGYERDPLIQHSLNIVMILPGCNPSGNGTGTEKRFVNRYLEQMRNGGHSNVIGRV